MKKPNKNLVEQIALERIETLFALAEKEFKKHPERSRRYVELARKISTRNRAKIPAELKKKFCKRCGAFLVKGKNAELRMVQKGLLEIRCMECGYSFKKPAKDKG